MRMHFTYYNIQGLRVYIYICKYTEVITSIFKYINVRPVRRVWKTEMKERKDDRGRGHGKKYRSGCKEMYGYIDIE